MTREGLTVEQKAKARAEAARLLRKAMRPSRKLRKLVPKWCWTCHRVHSKSDPCALTVVQVRTSRGTFQRRLIHLSPEAEPKKARRRKRQEANT